MFLSTSALCLLVSLTIVRSEHEAKKITITYEGTNAPIGEYPYQVSLRSTSNGHLCGASIISKTWILTAAHCVYNKTATSLKIVVGTNYLDRGGATYGLKEVIWHEEFMEDYNYNDIAVLRVDGEILSSTLQFSIVGILQTRKAVAPITLANTTTLEGVEATIMGWGVTSFPPKKLSNHLQRISLTTISISQCQNALPKYPIFDTNLCAYGNGKGACQGDSGGPLVVGDQQIGIISWGIPCAQEGKPDIFTNVAAYRDWIREKNRSLK